MTRHIPNLFTCLNLFFGCIATVMVFRNHLEWTAYLVCAAAICDLLDGLLARYFAIHSEFGKQMDSLADVISFGLVPAAVIFKLLQSSHLDLYISSEIIRRLLQFFPFIISVFSGLRLAKFNLDKRQTTSFIGLPTPANTLLIISFPMILLQFPGRFDFILLNPVFLLVISIILSWLLVSEIPLFGMKFSGLGIRENIYQYLLIVLSLILIPLLLFAAVPIIFGFYLLLSLLQNMTQKSTV